MPVEIPQIILSNTKLNPVNLICMRFTPPSYFDLSNGPFHLHLTGALQDYIQEKAGHLERHFDPLPEIMAHVTLSVVREQQRVEITLIMHGVQFRAEESTDDMYASIDLTVDKL